MVSTCLYLQGKRKHGASCFPFLLEFPLSLALSFSAMAYKDLTLVYKNHRPQWVKWQTTPSCMKCPPLVLFFLNKSSCFVDPGWSPLGDHFVLESIAHWVWAHFWPLQQVFVSTRKKLSNNFVIFIFVDLIIIHPALFLKSIISQCIKWQFKQCDNVKGLREWKGLEFTHICVALSPVSAHCEAVKLQLWSSGLLSLLRGIFSEKALKTHWTLQLCRPSLTDNSKPNPVF